MQTCQMTQHDTLLSAASQLPLAERFQFIDELWATVPEEAPQSLLPEWAAEIERRVAELDAGGETLVPWETVRRDTRQRLGLPETDDSSEQRKLCERI